MTFSVTMRTDKALMPANTARQYELYHANSRLDWISARNLADAGQNDLMSRFLGTRGFRQFEARETVPVDRVTASRRPLQAIMAQRRSARAFAGSITRDALTSVLDQALGCTHVLMEGEAGLCHALRAWPSGGGLYPLDCYVAARDVEGLRPALYHFNPVAQRLEMIRDDDIDALIGRAFFEQDIATTAAAALIFVANFDRTVAKYGERGYRLVLLDAGHAGQNVLLVAEQFRLGATAIGGFCDEALSRDLGIDGVSEAPVHAIVLGRAA